MTLVKKTLLKLKSHITPHILIGGDFSTPFTSMDRSPKQKVNRHTRSNRHYEANGPNKFIEHFTQIQKEYTVSAPYGIFSKTDHILGHKVSLNRYKETEVTPSILSDHYGLNLEFNNHRNKRMSTN
jgi:endonuclease/exonuclease/phosphatase family metal-dependent hydrolase